jgi:hypothetical protein
MKPDCFVSCLSHNALVVDLLAIPRFQEIHHEVTKTRREKFSPFFVTSCLCGESPGLRGERLLDMIAVEKAFAIVSDIPEQLYG